MASKPSPNAGDVPIVLDGEDFVLKPSLDCASTLSRQGGGFAGMSSRLATIDLDATVMVITQGLGLKGQDAKEVPGKVYRTGVGELAGPCIRFVNNLANGGRPPNEEEGDDTGNSARPQMASS